MISRLLLFNLPTPHTLHPTPYTPHPTPHTLPPGKPFSADPTAGVFDPSYLIKHKLGTEKEFFQQMDHHEYLRFPLEHIQDVHKFKLNSTSESLAERSRLQHEQSDRFFEADLNNAYNSQSNFQDRLRFFQGDASVPTNFSDHSIDQLIHL